MRLGDGKTVSFYNGIMKILTLLSLLVTIINPYTINANGSYSSKIQASYEYGVNYVGIAPDGTGGTVSSQYYIDFNINFDAYYSGTIYINMRSPVRTSSGGITWGSSTYPQIVVIGGEYITTGYTNVGSTSFGIKITNVNSLFVRLYYKDGVISSLYDVPTTNKEQKWVTDGGTYIYPTSLNTSNLIVNEGYTPYIDGIETSLSQISSSNSTIAGTLTTINTRLQILSSNNTVSLETLKDIMNNAYNLAENNFQYNEWINGVIDSKSHELNTGFYDLNNWSRYTSNESDNSTYYGKFTVKDFEPRDENVYIILALPRSTGQTQLYYFTYPLGVGSTEMAQYIYIYDLDTNYIYRYGMFSSRVNGVSYFRFVTDRLSLNDFTLTNRTDYINGIYITNSPVTELGVLYDVDRQLKSINEMIGNINISNTDLTNKNTVDNFFDNLLQNLNLPSFPSKDNEPMFPILQEFIGYYGQIIGNQHLSMYRWLLGISAVFLVLKVILL